MARRFSEYELQLKASCMLRDAILPPTEPRKLFQAAQAVLTWGVLRQFQDDSPTLRDCRERFAWEWKRLYYPEYATQAAPAGHPTFWAGPRKARLVGKKIHDFLRSHEIQIPVQPYTLTLSGYEITGSYMMTRSHRGGRVRIVVTETHTPRYVKNHSQPTLVGICRWAHMGFPLRVEIYHLPLLQGDAWSYVPRDAALALDWINLILSTVAWKSGFPSPGPHCESCITKNCLGILK